MLLSKHHTFSKVKFKEACIISHDWIAQSLCCILSLEVVSYFETFETTSTQCFCYANHLFFNLLQMLHSQNHLIATMKHYFVHLPSSKKRNNNWIKPNKLIFLPLCHSLSQQKMKEYIPDGPSCGLGTGGFVRKIKIRFTFPSNKQPIRIRHLRMIDTVNMYTPLAKLLARFLISNIK